MMDMQVLHWPLLKLDPHQPLQVSAHREEFSTACVGVGVSVRVCVHRAWANLWEVLQGNHWVAPTCEKKRKWHLEVFFFFLLSLSFSGPPLIELAYRRVVCEGEEEVVCEVERLESGFRKSVRNARKFDRESERLRKYEPNLLDVMWRFLLLIMKCGSRYCWVPIMSRERCYQAHRAAFFPLLRLKCELVAHCPTFRLDCLVLVHDLRGGIVHLASILSTQLGQKLPQGVMSELAVWVWKPHQTGSVSKCQLHWFKCLLCRNLPQMLRWGITRLRKQHNGNLNKLLSGFNVKNSDKTSSVSLGTCSSLHGCKQPKG